MFAGTPIESEGSVVDGEILEITETLTLGEVDIGRVLHWLGVIDGVEARVGSLRAEMHLRGDSLSEIFVDSGMSMRLEQGKRLLRDVNSVRELDISIGVGEWVMLPGEPMSISLDVGITANGSSIDHLLANGNGHLDFGVWPGKLKAVIFELWAVNVISAMAQRMDDSDGSKVNRVVARFKLENGVMNDHIDRPVGQLQRLQYQRQSPGTRWHLCFVRCQSAACAVETNVQTG